MRALFIKMAAPLQKRDNMHERLPSPCTQKTNKHNTIKKSRNDHGDDKPDGRVGRLDEHTMGYYRRVAQTVQDGFQDDTEKDLFFNNVFKQMEAEEVKLCRNQTVSRILEDVLMFANPPHLLQFLESILVEFEVVATDRFAGHVVQRTLFQAIKFFDNNEFGKELQEKVLSMAELVHKSLDAMMTDTYGSHILRTIIQILGGVRVPDQIARSKLSRNQQNRGASKGTEVLLEVVPEKLQLSLKRITNSILSAEKFNEYILHYMSSPVLVVLLLVLQHGQTHLCHRLVQAILKKSKFMKTRTLTETDNRIPVVLTDSIGSHLFEVIIQVVSMETFADVYSQCFSAHLVDMALHPMANFVLQKLLKRAATQDEFSDIFDKLCGNLEAILGVNHMGVVLRLAEACATLPSKQSGFVQSLLSAFHCWEPKARQSSSVLLLSSMLTYEVFFEEKTDATTKDSQKPGLTDINLYGSLLIQELLKFKHCGPILAGFMALSEDDLLTMACCPPGSYLLEAFLTSHMVTHRKRDMFTIKAKSRCFEMACHKTGSRSIEAIFRASSMKIKWALCQALSEKDKQLQSNNFGKFIYHSCAIGVYKHHPQDWEELQTREVKKRTLFAEIIEQVDGEKTSKKKRKSLSGITDETKEELDKDDDIDEIFGEMTQASSSSSKKSKDKFSRLQKTGNMTKSTREKGSQLAAEILGDNVPIMKMNEEAIFRGKKKRRKDYSGKSSD